MNIFEHFSKKLAELLADLQANGDLPEGISFDRVTVEPPRDLAHGDLATNAAMVLAKPAQMKPRDLATKIALNIESWEEVETVEIAGPGFLNLRLNPSYWQRLVGEVVAANDTYGQSSLGAGQRVNVEYVSTNPTGPLHVGHVRGAVVGDVLASLMAKAGFDVTREYYVNDAGAQVDVLAQSAFLRYREALGESIEIPDGLYPGDYLKAVGEELKNQHGNDLLEKDEAEWLPIAREVAINAMLDAIKQDLADLGVKQLFSSERTLVANGRVQEMIQNFIDRGLIYRGTLPPPKGKPDDDWEPREQELFRATDFGDDVDRPLRKSDGSFTYFGSDIAYHADKVTRGADHLIDVWGADHAGYVKRLTAAVSAASEGRVELEVIICNLVKLMRGDEEVKMSKRAGNFVTLRELLEEVGPDAIRFLMLTRRNAEPFNFDLQLAVDKSRDNPLWYVQYANARCNSVISDALVRFEGEPALDSLKQNADSDTILKVVDLAKLDRAEEMAVIRLLAQWPRVVETAAATREPHRVAFYLIDLAGSFHSLWSSARDDSRLRFIVENDSSLSLARLALVKATQITLGSALGVMGIAPQAQM